MHEKSFQWNCDGYFQSWEIDELRDRFITEWKEKESTLTENKNREGLNQWRKSNVLVGTTPFGQVWEALFERTGEVVCVKEVQTDVPIAKAEAQASALWHEISILRSLRHKNIVSFIGVSSLGQHPPPTFLMELCAGGSISTVIKNFGALEEAVARNFTGQILSGLDYLHRHHIVHNDLKCGNCLLTEDGIVKLAHFGMSVHLIEASKQKQTARASFPHPAPEARSGQPVGRKRDIWSLGACVVEMFCDDAAVASQYTTQLSLIQRLSPGSSVQHKLPASVPLEGCNFISSCFAADARTRPSAHILRQHPFITGTVSPPAPSDAVTGSAPIQRMPSAPKGVQLEVYKAADTNSSCACSEASNMSLSPLSAPQQDLGRSYTPALSPLCAPQDASHRLYEAMAEDEERNPSRSVTLPSHSELRWKSKSSSQPLPKQHAPAHRRTTTRGVISARPQLESVCSSVLGMLMFCGECPPPLARTSYVVETFEDAADEEHYLIFWSEKAFTRLRRCWPVFCIAMVLQLCNKFANAWEDSFSPYSSASVLALLLFSVLVTQQVWDNSTDVYTRWQRLCMFKQIVTPVAILHTWGEWESMRVMRILIFTLWGSLVARDSGDYALNTSLYLALKLANIGYDSFVLSRSGMSVWLMAEQAFSNACVLLTTALAGFLIVTKCQRHLRLSFHLGHWKKSPHSSLNFDMRRKGNDRSRQGSLRDGSLSVGSDAMQHRRSSCSSSN